MLGAIGSLLLAGGCETNRDRAARAGASVTVEPEATGEAWRRVATDADEDRIQRLGLAWQSALADAKRRHSREIAAEGALLEPLAALPRPAPSPGSYSCRLVRLGNEGGKGPVFEKFKPFFCYVEAEDELLTIVKQTGSERPAGRLWPDTREDRLIFLGSLALANEDQPLAYGDDPKRDMAGVFERVEPFRWRLVIPWPPGTSKLDVFELTPVADQPE